MAGGYQTLSLDRRGPVGWLIFDRPEAANAMDATMLVELERAWAELEADPEVRVIVNTGRGSSFQTGLDVVQLARDPEALREQARRTRRAELRITAWHNQVTKPVIAAVNGVCAGGGLHFVADADIVVMAGDATLVDPHVSIGQVSAFETIALARRSPMEAITRLALIGRHERMTAGRAQELGIASEVVDPPERLDESVQNLAEKIARHPPMVLAGTKAALWAELERIGQDRRVEASSARLDRMEVPHDQEERLGRKRRPPNQNRTQAMTYSHYQTLIVERRGPVGWLIFDRPDQLNAMNSVMRDELARAWIELDADPEVRVIVHTGRGRAFQTGVDVNEIATDGIGMERYRESLEQFDLHFTAWHQQVDKPVITAVNGLCAGGAFHWVADADIVIAAADAEFFDPHVSIGQVVALEAIGLLRKMPAEAVMRMALVGRHERMSAHRAYQLGMISEVVDPPEQLETAAQELAEKVARNSPAAMAATKRALWGALEMGLTDACRAGAAELVSMWGHPDQTEGPQAFAEKRSPCWAPPPTKPDQPDPRSMTPASVAAEPEPRSPGPRGS